MKAFGLEIGGGAPKQPLVVGGVPSVDLLPAEVRIAKRSRRIMRGVIAGAVAVVVLAGIGAVGAKAQSLWEQTQLAAGEARTLELLQAQAQFNEVTSIQDEIGERAAARSVVTSQEIDWRSVISSIRGLLPAGTGMVEVAVEGAPPMELYAQASAPLQGPRLATVTFTTEGASPDAGAQVLDALVELDGYVDAQVPSRTGVDGVYETAFVVHLDAQALANRFPAEDVAPATGGAATGDTAAGTAEPGEEESN